MKKKIVLFFAVTIVAPCLHAMVPYEFHVPDIPGYVTLAGDFHVHTCFSDGTVWPRTRVAEAAMPAAETVRNFLLSMPDVVLCEYSEIIPSGNYNFGYN